MFTLYKPTQKNSGGAASFKAGQGGVFVEVLKQKSWDEKEGNGTFDKDDKLVIFLKDVELASILRTIGKKDEKFDTVHVQKDNTSTKISYTPWVKDDKLMGYGFSLIQGDKKRSVSMNLNETELFRQFLVWALGRAFYYAEDKNLEAIKKSKKKADVQLPEVTV